MQSRIRLPNGHIVDAGWLLANLALPPVQALLAETYPYRTRPVCLCLDPPLGLYIRRLPGRRFTLARMPGTRQLHAPDCCLYTAEPSLHTARNGVRVREGGMIEVDLAPALLDDNTGVTTFAHRLDAGALLRLLWSEARLNLWHGTEGLRWDQVRGRLLDTAGRLLIDMKLLRDHLFLPATWNEAARDQLRLEAEQWMQQLARNKKNGLVLGVARRLDTGWRYREGRPSARRYRLYLQHFGVPFDIDALAFEQCRTAAADAWQTDTQPQRQADDAGWIWSRDPVAGRLMVLMSVRVSEWRGRYFLSAGTLGSLRVSTAFIPGNDPDELGLAETLVAAQRIFHKPLTRPDGSFAFATGFELLDCGDKPVPLQTGAPHALPPRQPHDAPVP